MIGNESGTDRARKSGCQATNTSREFKKPFLSYPIAGRDNYRAQRIFLLPGRIQERMQRAISRWNGNTPIDQPDDLAWRQDVFENPARVLAQLGIQVRTNDTGIQ